MKYRAALSARRYLQLINLKSIDVFRGEWYNTFVRWLTVFGALAQLVARNVRIVEVRGSNPLCSIRRNY